MGADWFTTVMGTGIVAVAGVTLPVRVPGLRPFATSVWLADVLLLAVLGALVLRGRSARPDRAGAGGEARAGDDAGPSPFAGAPPMACTTVAAATLVLGPAVLGRTAAGVLGGLLWTGGAVSGVVVAVAVPYLRARRRGPGRGHADARRLVPVVPPMVSAAVGALLVPYLPAGDRGPLVAGCGLLAAGSAVATVLVLTGFVRDLARAGPGPPALVPTLAIVLGPLGQSVTAAIHLVAEARPLVPSLAAGLHLAARGYGVAVWLLALAWLVVTVAATVRVARRLPFGLTWWSYTFPLGTVVTGGSALAADTGVPALAVGAVVLYALLLAVWAVVAVRTLRGVARRAVRAVHHH